MKPKHILPALFASALASHAAINHPHLAEVLARAIDPKTMDPVRFSVLSVLKTAMPTANAPLPTGGVEPEWYQKLPADVKALLPSLYPAQAEAAATSSQSVSQTSAVPSLVTSSVVVSTSIATSSTSASASGAEKANVTKSLQHAPTGTAGGNATVPSTTRILNGTLATATISPFLPSPSGLYSAGAKNVIRMEALAALVWLGVGAGFVAFA